MPQNGFFFFKETLTPLVGTNPRQDQDAKNEFISMLLFLKALDQEAVRFAGHQIRLTPSTGRSGTFRTLTLAIIGH